jgi:hypothetical protein
MTIGFRTRVLASSNSHFALARWPLPPVRQIYWRVTSSRLAARQAMSPSSQSV